MRRPIEKIVRPSPWIVSGLFAAPVGFVLLSILVPVAG